MVMPIQELLRLDSKYQSFGGESNAQERRVLFSLSFQFSLGEEEYRMHLVIYPKATFFKDYTYTIVP
ncbi:hypothetical protein QQP08_003483 [Theobroma cacao]|nr:hypothetical protein QQP08_003483 [Theobroma cacao]